MIIVLFSLFGGTFCFVRWGVDCVAWDFVCFGDAAHRFLCPEFRFSSTNLFLPIDCVNRKLAVYR